MEAVYIARPMITHYKTLLVLLTGIAMVGVGCRQQPEKSSYELVYPEGVAKPDQPARTPMASPMGEMPAGHPPMGGSTGMAGAGQRDDMESAATSSLAFVLPEGWREKEPMPNRNITVEVPAEGEAESAEAYVSVIAMGIKPEMESMLWQMNVRRWSDAVSAEAGGQEVEVVEWQEPITTALGIEGRGLTMHAGQVMWHAVVIRGESRLVTAMLKGPMSTAQANLAAFRAFVAAIGPNLADDGHGHAPGAHGHATPEAAQ